VSAVLAEYFNLNDVSQTGLSATTADTTMQSVLFGTSGAASNSSFVEVSKPFNLAAATTFTMYALGATATAKILSGQSLGELYAECAYV
jgi:hypothetical protein